MHASTHRSDHTSAAGDPEIERLARGIRLLLVAAAIVVLLAVSVGRAGFVFVR